MIPLIKVNYTIFDIIQSQFVCEKSTKYRDLLINEIRKRYNVKNVLLTSSCRTAIYLLLKSLPQTMVVIPAYTCGVVVEAAKLAHKHIRYVDVDLHSFNVVDYGEISSDCIVIATHQYGLSSDIEQLVRTCHKNKAIVIEDCAGSLGSRIDDQLTGTYGDYAVFSFSASKTFQVPTKGGFIITNKPDFPNMDNIKFEPDFIFKFRQSIKGIGFCLSKKPWLHNILINIAKKNKNYVNLGGGIIREETYDQNFYEWQASIALKQFRLWNEIITKRKHIARMYHNGIHNQHIHQVNYDDNSVMIRIPILVKNREEFISAAKLQGIELGDGYEKIYYPYSCIIADKIAKHIVYLPISSHHSDNEIYKVIDFVNCWCPL
jgi:dTDP-4-amino-4,6-dideoxygalactose transaminase